MALYGQFSGGSTESSSSLRILHRVISNSNAILSDDAFTQTNPPCITTTGTISTQVDTTKLGVLSGSVAFCRPDQGSNIIGGPGTSDIQGDILADDTQALGYFPVGLFLNNANGNPFENTPGVASGIGPYTSGGGTYGNRLFETQLLAVVATTHAIAGNDITYVVGQSLVASRNGYLMPNEVLGTNGTRYNVHRNAGFYNTAEHAARLGANADVADADGILAVMQRGGLSTVIGRLKVVPDSSFNEIVFDQLI